MVTETWLLSLRQQKSTSGKTYSKSQTLEFSQSYRLLNFCVHDTLQYLPFHCISTRLRFGHTHSVFPVQNL